jgi:hypothetical protein
VADHLAALFADAARGQFPPTDGAIEVVPAPATVAAAIFGFTAHLVIAANGVDAHEVNEQLGGRDFSEWMAPRFVSWLADRTDTWPGSHDAVLCAFGGGPGEPLDHADPPDPCDPGGTAATL